MGATTKGIGGLVPTTIGPVPITCIAECKKMVPRLNDVTQFSDYWKVPHVPDLNRLQRLYSSKHSC